MSGMIVEGMRELLAVFECLPKAVKQPTYLGLCKYPGRRFEEICSRLLSFYLDPKKEHSLHDLFLRSLFEMIGINDIEYKENDITVKLEVKVEGKRLDILVEGRTFAIGIENKIYAGIYNPLEKYKNVLQKQGNKRNFLLVLSLRKLNNDEKTKVKENGFLLYTYKEYFDIIKYKLGSYISQGNLKYLAFIVDFIETMENMQGGSIMNKEIEAFFIDNSSRIDEMTKLYDQFNNERRQKVVDRLYELKDEISDATNEKADNNGWWIFEDYLLGYTSPSRIQVDAVFESTRENPLDKCRIFIVIKNNDKQAQENWQKVCEKTKTIYHDFEIQHNDYETYLTIAVISVDDNEAIIAKLQEVYTFLKNLSL